MRCQGRSSGDKTIRAPDQKDDAEDHREKRNHACCLWGPWGRLGMVLCGVGGARLRRVGMENAAGLPRSPLRLRPKPLVSRLRRFRQRASAGAGWSGYRWGEWGSGPWRATICARIWCAERWPGRSWRAGSRAAPRCRRRCVPRRPVGSLRPRCRFGRAGRWWLRGSLRRAGG